MNQAENISSHRDWVQEMYDDHEGAPYLSLLKKLPPELARIHIKSALEKKLSDDETLAYLQEVIEQREEATTVSFISDEEIEKHCEAPKEEIFSKLEKEVFFSPDIGTGQTAKVKRFDLELDNKVIPLAIKYLLTPTEKTLSASSEHDMIVEVERIQTIEKLEKDLPLKHLQVPHPYFHHKNEKLQCYGMELVDGVNLQQLLSESIDYDMYLEIKENISKIPQDELDAEIDSFFDKMHTYCLHGDIKPRNYMVDRSGKFYLIDFGQSVLATDISEKEMDAFQNLKDDEIKNSKTIFKMLFRKLRDA